MEGSEWQIEGSVLKIKVYLVFRIATVYPEDPSAGQGTSTGGCAADIYIFMCVSIYVYV